MSFDITNSNSVVKLIGLVGVVIASVSIYQEVWEKHNFLMDFFGLGTGADTSGRYVFMMAIVLFVSVSWATGKFMQESSLALGVIVIFVLVYYGFLFVDKDNTQYAKSDTRPDKPVTSYATYTATEMREFLLKQGFVKGKALDEAQKNWCRKSKRYATGEYTDNTQAKAKALRRCATGYFWSKSI